MTTNENSGAREGQGGWQPVPQGGEYDAEATAFVQLPPEDFMDAPLAAPGHGYVPPVIMPLTPAPGGPTGNWGQQPPAPPGPGGVHWPEPQSTGWEQPAEQPGQHHAQPPHGAPPAPGQDQQFNDAYVTGQWNFGEAGQGGDSPGGGSSSELTGQWAIPVAEGDLQDDSGEFSTALLASPWSGNAPPATLPGGATAPWATSPEPGPAGSTGTDPQDPAARTASPFLAEGHPGDVAEPDQDALLAPDLTDHSAGFGVGPGPAGAPGATAEPGSAALPPAAGAEPDAPHQPDSFHGPDSFHQPGSPHGPDSPHQNDPSHGPESLHGPDPSHGPDFAPDALPGPGLPGEPADGPEPGVVPEFTSEPLPDPAGASGEADGPAPDPAPLSSSNDSAEHPADSYVLRVNGADRPVTDAWIGESLLYVLRERLGLAGAKDGCSQGECGACNVQVDGRLVASCLVPAATAAGSEVRTVEGLAVDGEPSDVQRALANRGAVQCGFCIPGMAMTVHDLLEGNHAPSELETRQALCGNLCRCSGYRGVLDAVSEVAAERAASAEAAAAASEEARVPHQAPPGAGSTQPPHPHDGGMA